MYRETPLALAELRSHVRRKCLTSIPLGAYASRDRVRYLFLEPDGVEAAVAAIGPGDTLASSAAEWPLYDWDEREMRDAFGVVLDGHPDVRPLVIDGDRVPEPLIATGAGVTIVVVGPVHAGVIEPGRFTFSTGGETVAHLDAQFSYSHRGIERFLEARDALESAYHIARVCAACSVARSTAYASAIENLCNIEVTEPAALARLVFAEMERAYNHLFDLASAASGAGYGLGLTHGLGLKERVHRLCAAISGHRFMFDAVVPGGVREAALTEPAALRAELSRLRFDVEHFVDNVFHNRSVWSRFENAGVLDAQTAHAFGAVGPARRASGGECDVRTHAPYGAYRTIPVTRAHANKGDVAARVEVKRVELFESFRLMDEALAVLGSTQQVAPPAVRLEAGTTAAVTEGPRGAETVALECDGRGAIVRAHVISASYRNWPVVTRAMESNIVPDFPLVNKSFNLCYSCMDR